MVRSFRLLLFPALLAGTILSAQCGYAQAPAALPDPVLKAPTPANYDYNPLPTLPHPPEAPASLLQPAPATPPYSCDPLPGPYFQREALWDPPSLPQPGWFADAEVEIVKPNIWNHMSGFNATPGLPVQLPSNSLDWTAGPYIQVGYRLPSAFGAFALAYRGFGSEGTSTFAQANGPASLTSRMDMNQIDLDYLSDEYSLWPQWQMKWHVGARVAFLYFDSRADQSALDAAFGSGVTDQSESNFFWGIGPHSGFELSRCFEGTGLSALASVDGSILMGRIRQNFYLTDIGGASAATENSDGQTVPIINCKIGASWKPLAYPQVDVFLGYEFEYWWNVGRMSNTPDSRGEMKDNGIVLRVGYNF